MKSIVIIALLTTVALCDPTRTSSKPNSDMPLIVLDEGPIPTVGPMETAVHLVDLPTDHFTYVGEVEGGDSGKGAVKKQDDIGEADKDDNNGKNVKKASNDAGGLVAVSTLAMAGAVILCLF